MCREGKKKGLEGEEGWPEDRDEVSATQKGRAKRAGGVTFGGAQAGGDRARAWAASEHGLEGAPAQRGTVRRMVSSGASAATGSRAAVSVATQQPVWAPTLGTRGRVVAGRVESGTSLRTPALEA